MIRAILAICIFSYVSFMGGQVYGYAQNIEAANKALEVIKQ